MTMLEKTLTLKTRRLLLRPFEEGDLEHALHMFYDEDLSRTYMLPEFPDRESAVSLFRRLQKISLMPGRIDYAIDLNGRLIGFINDCGIEGGSAELGYAIDPSYQNRGYATEALAAVIAELFRMGINCVQAAHFEENPASARVMLKCGMHKIDKAEDIEYRGQTHKCLYYEIKNDPKQERK